MTLDELAQKAIEESNGKTFYGVGNSSRGKTALPLFIEYLQSIDSGYTLEYDWQQPKNNKIFDQLTADALKGTGTYKHSAAADIYYTDHSIQGSENEYMAHKLKNQHAPGGL